MEPFQIQTRMCIHSKICRSATVVCHDTLSHNKEQLKTQIEDLELQTQNKNTETITANPEFGYRHLIT